MSNPDASQEKLFKLFQAHEYRLDYNFNAIIHLSTLLEFLYDELEKKGIGIDMEGFEDFQKTRLAEIEKTFSQLKDDDEATTKIKENLKAADINLSDDNG